MPLHLDKRPTTLDEFKGNEGIKESLRAVLTRTSDIPKSILFVGPSGCGKTTLARIASTMVNCHPDSIIECNSSNNRGIDSIKEISNNAHLSPMVGKVKVYIIDECHGLTKDAQNALLKILEDTPKHFFFFLFTTDPYKLIKAIRTRCMCFEVKKLPRPIISQLIKDTLVSEGIPLSDFSEKVISAIVKAADGCPRQAMILLDSVIDLIDEDVALAAVSEAMATETASIEICRLLIDTKPDRWDTIRVLLKDLPDEAESMRYAIMGYMQSIILNPKSDNKTAERAVRINDCFMESFMYSKKPGLVNSCYYACQV